MPGNSTLFPAEETRGVAADFRAGADAVAVAVDAVDALVAGPVAVLKVDCEGAELACLEGAPRALAAAACVVVEVHDVRGRLAACDAVLRRHGFDVDAEAAPGCPPGTFLLFGTRRGVGTRVG